MGDPRRYTWDRFIRAAVYCVNEQGSALYDATLGDPELIEELFEKAKAEQSSKRRKTEADKDEYRPSRRGYTRTVEKLHDIEDNLIASRAEAGKWKPSSVKFSRRPLFPSEAVQERMRKRARAHTASAIAAAQERYRRNRER